MAIDPDVRTELELVQNQLTAITATLGTYDDRLETVIARLDALEHPPPEIPPALFDSRIDGWQLGTLFGTDCGTYGHATNTRHEYRPDHVIEGDDGSLTLISEKVDGKYVSGAISARESHGASDPLRTPVGDGFLAEVDITLHPRHALWPAVWGRHYPGGAGSGEIDLLELFTADDGSWRARQTLHKLMGGPGVNEVMAYPQLGAGSVETVRARFGVMCQAAGGGRFGWTFTYNGKPTGLRRICDNGNRQGWRDGPVLADSSTADWPSHRSESSFDWMLNVAIGGDWVGDPDGPYVGQLQNGRDGAPVDEVPSWDGSRVATVIHSFRVVAL